MSDPIKEDLQQWKHYALISIGIVVLIGIVVATVLFYILNVYAISDIQHIPVVNNAGIAHSLFNNTEHIHSAALVTDADSDLVSYYWQFLTCPSTCPTLAQANGEINGGGSSVYVPGPVYTPNALGNYTLLLTITDSLGQTNALGWGDSKSGMVTYNSGIGLSSDVATAMTIDSSKNIYVTGWQTSNGYDWAIRKYTSAGILDTTWGTSGIVTYNSGTNTTDLPKAITIDASRNIYVAGRKLQGASGADWAIRKYTSTSQLDTTWGSGGMVTYDSAIGTNSGDIANSIIIDSLNNIYVAGQKEGLSGTDWAIRKYTSTGQLDTTWGSGGMVTYDGELGGSGDWVSAIAIDANRNIYAAGRRNGNSANLD